MSWLSGDRDIFYRGDGGQDLRLFLGGSCKTDGRLVTIPLHAEKFATRTPKFFEDKDLSYDMSYVEKNPVPILLPEGSDPTGQENGLLLAITARNNKPYDVKVSGYAKIIARGYYNGSVCPVVHVTGNARVVMLGVFAEKIKFTDDNGVITISLKDGKK